ncbi:hypothetical protein A8950_3497 [Dongia mobilis]|uniref:Tail collar domain n=1 Tax=Dongia mobilis TaxID=578943 RepID=A0A4R6WEY4_9PROT|nr:hypothetical protein [Dongia mobilis]TDQ78445.1 hypothetical protein A8950_3497 [Dongia mobilis]
MPSLRAILVVSMLAAPGTAFAAGNCDALLQHGLYNISVSKYSYDRTAFLYDKYCRKQYETFDSSKKGQIDVEVFGYGSGDGSMSDDLRKTKLDEWCQTNRSSSSDQTDQYQEVRTINDAAVRAWETCTANKEVDIDPILTDGNQRHVLVNLKYTGAGSGIAFGGVSPHGYTCGYRAFRSKDEIIETQTAEGGLLTNRGITVDCWRDEPETIEQDGQSFHRYKPGSLAIYLAGNSLLISFVEQIDPLLPSIREYYVPQNAVMAFNAAACPKGWQPFAEGIGRTIVGVGSAGSGLPNVSLLAQGGSQVVSLTANNLPPHAHVLPLTNTGEASTRTGISGGLMNSRDQAGFYYGRVVVSDHGNAITSNAFGPGAPVDVTNPYVGLLLCQKQ